MSISKIIFGRSEVVGDEVKVDSGRRQLATWMTPVVAVVVLPAHGATSVAEEGNGGTVSGVVCNMTMASGTLLDMFDMVGGYTFLVPVDVSCIRIEVQGGGGGGAGGSADFFGGNGGIAGGGGGGAGVFIDRNINVNPGDIITGIVGGGGEGAQNSVGGVAGMGAGNSATQGTSLTGSPLGLANGGGGGGASSLLVGSDSIMANGGGGGSAGGNNNGDGGDGGDGGGNSPLFMGAGGVASPAAGVGGGGDFPGMNAMPTNAVMRSLGGQGGDTQNGAVGGAPGATAPGLGQNGGPGIDGSGGGGSTCDIRPNGTIARGRGGNGGDGFVRIFVG